MKYKSIGSQRRQIFIYMIIKDLNINLMYYKGVTYQSKGLQLSQIPFCRIIKELNTNQKYYKGIK